MELLSLAGGLLLFGFTSDSVCGGFGEGEAAGCCVGVGAEAVLVGVLGADGVVDGCEFGVLLVGLGDAEGGAVGLGGVVAKGSLEDMF